MRKLFNLKKWVTLSEACEHLSSIFNEPVSTADLYRFALEKHLVLSVHFVNFTRGSLGTVRPLDEAELRIVPAILSLLSERTPEAKAFIKAIPRGLGREATLAYASEHPQYFQSGEVILMVSGDRISETEVIDFDPKPTTLRDIWDLPMIGAERLDIEHALQQEVSGPAVDLVSIDGALVRHPDTGQFAKLLENFDNNEYADKSVKRAYDDPKSYYPAGGLPADAPVVVRTAALSEFISAMSGVSNTADRQIAGRERNNLLRVIAALAREAKIGIEEGGKGVLQIEAAVAGAGFDGPKDKTIREILAQARGIT